jgi:hypothetical protein
MTMSIRGVDATLQQYSTTNLYNQILNLKSHSHHLHLYKTYDLCSTENMLSDNLLCSVFTLQYPITEIFNMRNKVDICLYIYCCIPDGYIHLKNKNTANFNFLHYSSEIMLDDIYIPNVPHLLFHNNMLLYKECIFISKNDENRTIENKIMNVCRNVVNKAII